MYFAERGTVNDLKFIMKLERQRLESFKEKYKSELRSLRRHRGYTLRRHRVKDKWYYYKVKEGEKTLQYLGDENNSEVQAIQRIVFCKAAIQEINKALKEIENVEKVCNLFSPLKVAESLPRVYRGTKVSEEAVFKEEGLKWRAEMEARKALAPVYKPEKLAHYAIDGAGVRSKSEVLIYNYLFERGYIFVYELPIDTPKGRLVPDFTIYNVVTGEVIFWEHMGMIYDEEYYSNQYDKIVKYASIGYTPGVNLIITVDDINGKIDMQQIVRALSAFNLQTA